MRRIFCCSAFLLLLPGGTLHAASKTFELTVAAGDRDRANEPVSVLLAVPSALAKATHVELQDAAGKKLTAQLTAPGLLAKIDGAARELHFILPALKSGATASFKATVSDDPPAKGEGFSWHDTKGDFMDLKFGDRPVLRYIYAPLDESTKETRDRTYKVYHHLYDPSGEVQVTGAMAKLDPHHRGIYYGFNKLTYGDGKKADVWHGIKKGNEDAHQTHEKVLATEAGPVLGRQRVEIAWHGEKKEVFAMEERELTVYNVPGGQLVEFASRLRTTDGSVKLDGDPQHAGFHFRAHTEAEKTKDQTVFIRPDGVGQPGQKGTRNWPAQKDHVNLPWNAMSFVLGEQRFTVAYLDKPTNPKEARASEREYGRIGSYFEYEVTEKKPLQVNYRLWLQEGQMKPDEVAAKSTAFVAPVEVTVK